MHAPSLCSVLFNSSVTQAELHIVVCLPCAGACPPQKPLPSHGWRDLNPHLIQCSLLPKRAHDRFSRVCRAHHRCVQHTDARSPEPLRQASDVVIYAASSTARMPAMRPIITGVPNNSVNLPDFFCQHASPTRSSAIAEGPRDASCQLKSCQLPRHSAETTCTTSPEQTEVMKLEGYSAGQCVINMCTQP